MSLPALTVWQPWATFVILGIKPWEYRPWPAPRAYRGNRIVIHAAARPVKVREVIDLMNSLESGRIGLVADGCVGRALELLDQWRREGPAGIFAAAPPPSVFPIAAGLGTVLLGTPQKALDIWSSRMDPDDIDPDMWAWPVSDPQPFPQPIAAKGAQGFWTWKEAA